MTLPLAIARRLPRCLVALVALALTCALSFEVAHQHTDRVPHASCAVCAASGAPAIEPDAAPAVSAPAPAPVRVACGPLAVRSRPGDAPASARAPPLV